MDNQTLISITAIAVSGAVGFAGVALNFRKFVDSESMDRAVRRTSALQMISDEEGALLEVEMQCRSIETLIHANHYSLGDQFEHLKSEAARINMESQDLIITVRKKREGIRERIQDLSAAEIESVIAEAYQGKMLAQAQLKRTLQSREDTIKLYLSRANVNDST